MAVSADFDFSRSVCSHGWFVLAPNRWNPVNKSLQTILDIDIDDPVVVHIRQGRSGLNIQSGCVLNTEAARAVRLRVARMLRLDEELTGFHTLCMQHASHRGAAETRFGRLLRGASLFEDVVKVICTCNVTWRQTVSMIDRLTAHWGKAAPGSTSRDPNTPALFAFPTPQRLARASIHDLRRAARLGYRAEFVSRFARDVAEGRIELDEYERFEGSTPELHKSLKRIHGIGNYAASNLCMLLGRYDCLAVDTELLRFLRERHPRRRFTPATIRRYYESWHPYQFLAYWWELWTGYETRHGAAHAWSMETVGPSITAPARSAGKR